MNNLTIAAGLIALTAAAVIYYPTVHGTVTGPVVIPIQGTVDPAPTTVPAEASRVEVVFNHFWFWSNID